jgi:hypothetical protein
MTCVLVLACQVPALVACAAEVLPSNTASAGSASAGDLLDLFKAFLPDKARPLLAKLTAKA